MDQRLNPAAMDGRVAPPPSSKRTGRSRPESPVAPESICRVVYRDDDLLVVDKSAGVPVAPSGAFQQRSVLRAVAAMGLGPCWPVHLLDAEVTGLVVLSRTQQAAKALRWNWRSALCQRQYLAVVQGELMGTHGRIALPIGSVPSNRGVRHQVVPRELGGRAAATTWQLLARGRGLTRLLVTLQGTRPHQLRIHLAAIGHPIVGDRYGQQRSTEVPLEALVSLPTPHLDAGTLPSHQIALHSFRLAMPHPRTNRPLELEVPPPQNVLQLMPGPWSFRPVASRAALR